MSDEVWNCGPSRRAQVLLVVGVDVVGRPLADQLAGAVAEELLDGG